MVSATKPCGKGKLLRKIVVPTEFPMNNCHAAK
uniref:Uncharacterized protein n=1 Tax=Arundo donax TaxID=35708 RepID=A0A0A8ZH12_ARUDO